MYSIYSSTKAAIVNLTQALSEEWANEKIRVNCINPERCDTPMRRSNFGLEPKETIVGISARLISNKASYKFKSEIIDRLKESLDVIVREKQ